ELIDNNDKLKNIVKLFDHHIGNMHLNDYEWAQVVKNEEKGQACATTIFYRYLINNYDNKILLGENVKELVELTRQIDTWEWAKNNNLDAKKIGDIFIFYGVKIFMEEYFKKLKNPKSKLFEEKENFIFDLEQEHINKYIEKKEKTLIIKQLNNYKVGIVYADIYKAHLGNVLAERYKDSIDFIIIIDLSKGISYRAFKDNIDLNEIAKIYGGGGHAKAAGSPLPESIRDKVFEIIFK
ncbi:MAG: DHHA1 domain-containing protein, partial [Bacilli bacterium]